MTEFTVHLANQRGMLACVTEKLAEAGINIEALAAFGVNEVGVVRVMVDDAAATRTVLRDNDITFEERPVQVTTLSHQPGAVASMTRQLADAGVNIDALYLLRSSAEGLEFAIGIDDPDAIPRLAG